MIIYNVTVSLSPEIEKDWLNWMKSKHIADVMNTKMFSEYRLSKVLTDPEEGGINYAIQYTCESMKKLEEYQSLFAPKLQKEHTDRYQDKFIAIRTLLEVIQ